MTLLQINPVGIGIKSPLTFVNGGLSLTASTYATVSNGDGIDGSEPTIEVLTATEEDVISMLRQSMARIIATPKGTRFYNGVVGSLASELVFEPNDEAMQTLAAAYGVLAIQEQEPRVAIQDASAKSDPERDFAVVVSIAARVQNTNLTMAVALPTNGE